MKKISVFLLRSLLSLFAALPLKLHYFNAGIVAALLSAIGYRRDDIMINLSRSFPEKKYSELKRIKKDYYRHIAYIIVEAVWFGGCSAERLRKARIAEFVNPEEIARIYENAPSTVLMCAHYGNWELSGGYPLFNYKDCPNYITDKSCCTVYKKLSSPVWDEIMRVNRIAPLDHNYQGYCESTSILRYMINHKDEKKFYIFITDQSPYAESTSSTQLEFMHQPTLTMTASASIARKFGYAVVYMSMIRDREGHYSITFKPICEDASKMDVETIMHKYYSLLTDDINTDPSSYLWSHRRWKIRVPHFRFLEACCGNAAQALDAQSKGACRIELCEQLEIGGVTPSQDNILQTISSCKKARVNVLIRARGGDFVYSEEEIQQMISSICFCKTAGANGVVIGALTAEGEVDKASVRRMIEAARPMSVTFHRAFDECADMSRSLEDIIDCGCDRLLTSGHMTDAFEGRFNIASLVNQAAGRIKIMAGCGVRASNIDIIERDSHADEFHGSSLF